MGDSPGLISSQSNSSEQHRTMTDQNETQDSGLTPAITETKQEDSIQESTLSEEIQTDGNAEPELEALASENNLPEDDQILRFREGERLLHWAIAMPFLLCWITALTLVVVYNPDPSRPFRDPLSWIHRISGTMLITLPLLALIRGRKDLHLHLYNIKTAWRWYLRDLKWLLLMLPATLIKRINLPEQDKFNAAEKINFILVMVAIPILAVTGLIMWMEDIPWISWLIHVSVAVVFTPVTLGHMYMAMINPETKKGITGMLSGYVDRDWAKHHYALWYKEEVARAAGQNGALTEGKKKSAG